MSININDPVAALTYAEKQIKLKMIQLGCAQRVSNAMAKHTKAYITVDRMIDGLVLAMKTYMFGLENERIVDRHIDPLWWECFVEENPEVQKALEKNPVKWTTKPDQPQYLAVCPHLDIDISRGYGDEIHLDWLLKCKVANDLPSE